MEKIAEQVKIIVELTRYSVFGKELKSFSSELDWQEIYRLAKKNMVIGSVADGVKATECADGVKNAFAKESARVLKRQILFDAARDEIFAQFDAQGVAYMQLKGKYFSSLYPRYGMREFSDNDILVKDFERRKIDGIFSGLGYAADHRSSVHDSYQKEPIYNFEIHKKLFSGGRFPEIGEYFSGVWERAVKISDERNEYCMTNEDLYLYALSHAYKHDFAGTGLRTFVDLYLLKESLKGKLDEEYVLRVAEDMKIAEFKSRAEDVCQRLFGEEECMLTEEEFCMLGGVGAYGSAEVRTQKAIEKYGKKLFWRRVFPPLKEIRTDIPILDKCPILYPFYVVGRAVKILFTPSRRENAVRQLKQIKEYKGEKERETEFERRGE